MPPESAARVVVLGGVNFSTYVVCHALRARYGRVPLVLETEPYRKRLVTRRLRKLGVVTVAGQLAFRAGIVPLLRLRAARRVREIFAEAGLDDSPVVSDVVRVRSVNDAETLAHLRRLAPAVVVVNGTWILSRETLGCVAAPFINTHAGITPFCRGVHGAYWALAEGRPDLVGTTVHLVDAGIDTGQVLGQATFRPGRGDSFATYPFLHVAAGVPLLLDAVAAALEGRLATRPSIAAGAPSRLRTHPTAWGYLWRRMVADVR